MTTRKRLKNAPLCPICNQPLKTYDKRKTYCSWDCYQKSKGETLYKACAQCGKEFCARDNATTRLRICCGNACAGLQRRGINSHFYRGKRKADRGWTWKEMQAQARERDKGQCTSLLHDPSYVPYRIEKCSVDHIIPYRVVMAWKQMGENVDPNHIDNLVSMCRRCHQIKTSRIETKLMTGDVHGFIEGLKTCIPESIVRSVLSLYGLFSPNRTIDIAKDWKFDRRPSDKPMVHLNSRGDKNANSKLTEKQIRMIISRRDEPRQKLATEFGTTARYVSSIISGTKWKYIERPYLAERGSRTHGFYGVA